MNEDNADKLRKEVLDELNANKEIKIDSTVETYGMKNKSTVSFSKKEDNQVDKEINNNEEKNNSSSAKLLLIGLIVCVGLVLLFPTINKKVSYYKNKSKKVKVELPKEEELIFPKLSLESDEVQGLKYPIMHNDNTNKETYYLKETISIADFTNNDILYNALNDVYEGNMAKYTGQYNGGFCGKNNERLALEARYLDLRVENLFTKNVNIKYTNIVVPNNNKSKYPGLWKYSKVTKTYIYYGECNPKNSNTLYYDLAYAYDVSASDKNVDIYVYKNIGFAAVDKTTKKYTIYKNANYTEEIKNGILTTTNYEKELNDIFVKEIDKMNLNKYKYTFSIRDCAYQDYCFIGGEYVK